MQIVRQHWGLIIVFVFSLIIISRIFHSGFFDVHDDVQPTRIFEMSKSLKDGLFPVRWVNDLGFGYGYPIFNFYAPLPYYIGSFFNLIGFDAITSTKIMYGVPVILAGVGMYFFVRSFLGVLPGVGAGVIYLYFPYFAINIFIRGAVGEYYAYSILPFIFWGLFKIFYKTSDEKSPQPPLIKGATSLIKDRTGGILDYKIVVISSIALAALIISHNLSAYMLGIILSIFLFGAVWFGNNKKFLIKQYFLVFVFAFLFSSFYSIPAIFEMNYTDVNSQLAGNFKYLNHFVCPIQWWDSPWGFAGSSKGCIDDGLSYRLGKSNIIFASLGIFFGIYFLFIKKVKKYAFLFLFSVFILIFSLFMMTEYSQFVWKILPKIEFIQFPWRFLNFTGLALSILTGFFIFYLNKKRKIVAFTVCLIIILCTFGFNLKLFSPQFYNKSNSNYYTDKRQVNFRISKITNEYMPQGFTRPENANQVPQAPIKIVNGSGDVDLLTNKTGLIQASIRLKNDGEVRINKAYFPAWKIYVNNEEAHIKKIDKGMLLLLKKGVNDVRLEFVQTSTENLANILTLAGVIALFIGIIRLRKENINV